MQTYETITITVPLEDSYSFSTLRQRLSDISGEEIPKSTLYDWIKNVCLLRSSNIYGSTYNHEEVKHLLTWLAFRSRFKRGQAVKQFSQYLVNQMEVS